MTRYSDEPRTRRYVEGYGLLSFARNLSKKYEKKLLDTVTKQDQILQKTASKGVVHKTAEATGVLIINKIAEKIMKPEYLNY